MHATACAPDRVEATILSGLRNQATASLSLIKLQNCYEGCRGRRELAKVLRALNRGLQTGPKSHVSVTARLAPWSREVHVTLL